MSLLPENATVILVHGAWADGSSWQEFIRFLLRQGIRVIAAPIPLTPLSDDAAALGRALQRTNGPVFLAAHAYAGAVISVPNEERIKALVFIAASTPDEGKTMAQMFYREQPHSAAPQLSPDADGFIWMPDDAFPKAFAQNAPSELTAMQWPIGVRCINEPVHAPSWKTRPSWYLLAEEDRMINPKAQRFMAERMDAKIQSAAVDHFRCLLRRSSSSTRFWKPGAPRCPAERASVCGRRVRSGDS
jgi:pimeloyl-ACP methyl ester carboxylesterase